MANTKEIVYMRGNLHWAKVLGDPVDNYNKDGKEWIFDLALDGDGVKQLKSIKVQGKPAVNIKDKEDERGQFITLKQRATRRDGTPNKPIPVMDANGKPWNPDDKLGNGTVADVKFEVIDFGKGMYPGVYPRAIRVLDHVAFNSQEFAPLGDDDEYFKKGATASEKHLPDANDDLDDDIAY